MTADNRSFINQRAKGTEMTDSIRTYIKPLQGKCLMALRGVGFKMVNQNVNLPNDART